MLQDCLLNSSSLVVSGPRHGEKSQDRWHPRDLQWVHKSEGLSEDSVPLDPGTAAELWLYVLLVPSAPTSLQVFLVLPQYHLGNRYLKDAPLLCPQAHVSLHPTQGTL